MSELVSRMLWFTVVSVAVAYASYLVAGSIVNAQSSDAYRPVIIRDELGAGVHHLSGMVMVPSPCHELSVRTESPTPYVHTLVFSTWREPSVECKNNEMPRYFQAVLFAPAAGVTFTATLDDAGLPIEVIAVLPVR